MKKAAWIRVALTVEGEADPASDFSKTAIDAVRSSLKIAVPAQYQGLRISLTKIYEDATPPEDEGGDSDEQSTPTVTSQSTSGSATTTSSARTPSRSAKRTSRKRTSR